MKKEEYLLTYLIEELSELQKCISKCIRFGKSSFHPNGSLTNIQEAQAEYSDIIAVIEILNEYGVKIALDVNRLASKRREIRYYLECANTNGICNDSVDELGFLNRAIDR